MPIPTPATAVVANHNSSGNPTCRNNKLNMPHAIAIVPTIRPKRECHTPIEVRVSAASARLTFTALHIRITTRIYHAGFR